MQVAFDEGQGFGILVDERATNVLTVQIAGIGQARARKSNGLDGAYGSPALRVAAKQQETGEIEFASIAQTQVL